MTPALATGLESGYDTVEASHGGTGGGRGGGRPGGGCCGKLLVLSASSGINREVETLDWDVG